MQRNVDDAIENGEDAILCFKSLLELQVLVPERMREEVEPYAVGCSLE